MYDLDRQLYSDTDRIGKRLSSHADPSGQALSCPLTKKHKRVLAILIVALALMVYGTLRFSWSVRQLAAVFLVLGIGVGILERLPSDEISGLFLKGSSSRCLRPFWSALELPSSLILSAGGITDTIIHALSQTLSLAPRWSQGACMYLANTLVNVFITSGTAQASGGNADLYSGGRSFGNDEADRGFSLQFRGWFFQLYSSHLQRSDGDPGRGENPVWAVGEVYGENVSDLGRALLPPRHHRPSDPAGAVLMDCR